jgi:hypothetical protein
LISPVGNTNVAPEKYAGGGLIPPAANATNMVTIRSIGSHAHMVDIMICDATATQGQI